RKLLRLAMLRGPSTGRAPSTPAARWRYGVEGLPNDSRSDSSPKGHARSETLYKPAGNTEKANRAKTRYAANHRAPSAARYLSYNNHRPKEIRHSTRADTRESSQPPRQEQK